MNTKKDISRVDRENILNNELALSSIQQVMNLPGVIWDNNLYFSKEFLSTYFGVDPRTIERLVEANRDELINSGYRILTNEELSYFIRQFGTDINVGTKTTKLGIYSFRAFLNIAMLLQNSEKAKQVRSQLLDITLGILTERTGGHNFYINQRDPQFLETAYNTEVSRKKFTAALNQYVDMGVYKYEYFTNQIYKAIFAENASEYQKILRLKSKANLRDTMYSEILDNIAAVEAGVAQDIIDKAIEKRDQLTKEEVDALIIRLVNHPSMQTFIHKARQKMASRDSYFRDAYHKNLQSYITSVDPEDFKRFLGEKSKSMQEQIDDHIDIFKRLKDK